MNNLYDLIVSVLGNPPNNIIQDLYYVLAVWLIIYIFKLLLMLIRSIFNIKN